MSFQNFERPRPAIRTISSQKMPRIRATPPDDEEVIPAPRPRKVRSVVLHGKVQHVYSDHSDEENDDEGSASSIVDGTESIRESLQRRSDFSQLTRETQQFGKLVAELETVLRDAGSSAELAWRARILMRGAEETGRDLWSKLYRYEHNLLAVSPAITNKRRKPTGEMRMAQFACMKLHRDFKRSHKTLVMLLTEHERRQRAEISQLGAVPLGWGGGGGRHEEEFFDRAMRERELEKMNKSMHQVHEIYQELARLVDAQQDGVDAVENQTGHARANVHAAAQHVGCLSLRERVDCNSALDEVETYFYGCRVVVPEDAALRENPSMGSWAPRFGYNFASLKEDFKAVQEDILDVGLGLINKGQSLQCGVEVPDENTVTSV